MKRTLSIAGVLPSIILTTLVLSATLTPKPAVAIEIGLDRLLGTVEPGAPANEVNEMVMLNFLIEAYNVGTATGNNLGDNLADPQDEDYYLHYTPTTFIPDDPNAPLATAYVAGGGEVDSLSTGSSSYEWVSVKYGPNTAFFYIGDLGVGAMLNFMGKTEVPFASGGGVVSHSTFFTANRVPDGGLTLALLGMGIIGLVMLRRHAA